MNLRTTDKGRKGETRPQMFEWFRLNMFWDQVGDQGYQVLDQLSTGELDILAEKVQNLKTRYTQSKGRMDQKPATIADSVAKVKKHDQLRAELKTIEDSYIDQGVTPEKRARALEIIEILKSAVGQDQQIPITKTSI